MEETIRSILLPGYPSLEYIIIDGGSSDETLEVLQRYAPWIDYWESVPDSGQANAINKGFRRATGQIFQWINSDDLLAKGALALVGAQPESRGIIAGGVLNFGENISLEVIQNFNLDPAVLINSSEQFGFQQPGMFFRRAVLEEISANQPIPERYNYIFDWYLV
ncbi:glycosyltransferase, partial [Nostoc sp. NIES-2111]